MKKISTAVMKTLRRITEEVKCPYGDKVVEMRRTDDETVKMCACLHCSTQILTTALVLLSSGQKREEETGMLVIDGLIAGAD